MNVQGFLNIPAMVFPTAKTSNGFDRITLNGQDEVREAIYHERRVELCCENGLRYFDLRRWKKAEEVLAPTNVWYELLQELNFLMTKTMQAHSTNEHSIL